MCAVASAMIFAVYDILINNQSIVAAFILLLLSIALYGFSFYNFKTFLKLVPSISINSDYGTIAIGRNTFHVDDIEDIELTGKYLFNYIIKYPMEGMYLRLKNGTSYYLYDDLYENLYELKSYINKTKTNQQKPQSVLVANAKDIELKNTETFKNNLFKSSTFIFYLIVVIIFLIKLFNEQLSYLTLIFFVFFLCLWSAINIWLLNYFVIADNFLIIKNHFLFWKKHIEHIENIKEIAFERSNFQYRSVRIITRDYKSNLYPVPTLSKKILLKFKEALQKKKKDIHFRDEEL
ncbi:MAG: EbsA family protein [Cytophagales bacterium]|nr:EbsA family protein [Cytophagales bacterium]MDW8385219.1 hypothetical protein [Flammeovirgaceae bacterium]